MLSATWAVPQSDEPDAKWMMLIRVEEPGTDLDNPPELKGAWNATRHERFERLLRETGIPMGILSNDECIRLIYAPKGESSGHITFDFSQMALPAGRPILAAFEMLLSADALFMGTEEARLPTLLVKAARPSRKFPRGCLVRFSPRSTSFFALCCSDARKRQGSVARPCASTARPPLRRTDHGTDAPSVRAVYGRSRPDVRSSGLPAALFPRWPVRAVAG